MNITKLSTRHYRVRFMNEGKLYSKYYHYKPSLKEARKDLYAMIEQDKLGVSEKLNMCLDVYLKSKLNILSPATIRTYRRHIRAIPSELLNTRLNQINSIVLQKLINDYALTHEPKTTKAFFGFICSVIKNYCDIKIKVSLPPPIKKDIYIPTKENMIFILEESKNTRYYIPLLLASYGLRFGEIRALTLDDISNGKVSINKTIVYDENYKPVIKQPKTYESTRTINIPTFITDLILKKKTIYNGSNIAINRYLYKIQNKLNIPRFSIHKLRHFFATELHNRNVPSKYIQAMGGWATDNILKTIYTHANKELETINIFD